VEAEHIRENDVGVFDKGIRLGPNGQTVVSLAGCGVTAGRETFVHPKGPNPTLAGREGIDFLWTFVGIKQRSSRGPGGSSS
jgi:hypothetical protein